MCFSQDTFCHWKRHYAKESGFLSFWPSLNLWLSFYTFSLCYHIFQTSAVSDMDCVSKGAFEVRDYKVRKGTARLSCILKVVGECQFEDYKALVVDVSIKHLTSNGIEIQTTRWVYIVFLTGNIEGLWSRVETVRMWRLVQDYQVLKSFPKTAVYYIVITCGPNCGRRHLFPWAL